MIRTKKLSSYIFKELTGPFILGLFVFTLILLMNKLLKLMDMIINKGLTLSEVVTLVVFLIPSFLSITIPMSILLAILITLGRFSLDGEIIAIKASGISLYQMLPPFFALCCIGFIFTNVITLVLLPKGNLEFRNHLLTIAQRHAEANLKARVFNDDFKGLVLYINEISDKTAGLKGIFISDQREFEVPSIIIANKGMIISDSKAMKITLRLFDGSIHRTVRNSLAYQRATFKIYDMNLQLTADEAKKGKELKYREMGVRQLLKLARQRAKAKKSAVRIQVHLHERFAFPFACFVLGLVGIPLGTYRRKGSRSYGFVLSLMVFFLYYLFLNFGEAMAKRGIILPSVGIWLPNILLSILGFYLLYKAAREQPFQLLNWTEVKITMLWNKLKKRLS